MIQFSMTKERAVELVDVLEDALGWIEEEPTPEKEDEQSQALRMRFCESMIDDLTKAIREADAAQS